MSPSLRRFQVLLCCAGLAVSMAAHAADRPTAAAPRTKFLQRLGLFKSKVAKPAIAKSTAPSTQSTSSSNSLQGFATGMMLGMALDNPALGLALGTAFSM